MWSSKRETEPKFVMLFLSCARDARDSLAVAVSTLTAKRTRSLIKINWSAKWKRLTEVV